MGLKSLKKSCSSYQENTVLNSQQDFNNYIGNPVDFIQDVLGENLTTEQQKILTSVINNRVTNIPAGHGIGKSFISSRLVIYWVFVYAGLAITSAPTQRQVSAILWSEVRRCYDKHRNILGGCRGQLFLKLTESAKAFGYSASDYSSSAFQGVHHSRLLVILDESSGISEEIDNGAQSCVTGSENRMLRIGNPITLSTPFYKACQRSSVTIPVWSHPNVAWAYEHQFDGIHRLKPSVAAWMLDSNREVKPEEEWPVQCRSKVPGAVSVRWIEEVRTNHGESSAYWKSRVEAEFPTNDSDGIILLTLLKQARSRYDKNPAYWDTLAKRYPWRLGLDVGDGGDNHALALLRGPVLYEVQIHPTKGDLLDVDRAADIAANEIRLLGASYSISVDNTGVGAGTLAKLKKLGYIAHPCKFGDVPSYKKTKREPEQKFTNLKAELYWQYREALRLGRVAIAPLENEEYVFQDLTATRYSTNTKDEIFCEPKEKTKSRLGRSPDSEAVIIALNTPMDMGGVPQLGAELTTNEYTFDDFKQLDKWLGL